MHGNVFEDYKKSQERSEEDVAPDPELSGISEWGEELSG